MLLDSVRIVKGNRVFNADAFWNRLRTFQNPLIHSTLLMKIFRRIAWACGFTIPTDAACRRSNPSCLARSVSMVVVRRSTISRISAICGPMSSMTYRGGPLRWLGYDVTHVMNITDVGHLSGDDDTGEDKMVKTAEERARACSRSPGSTPKPSLPIPTASISCVPMWSARPPTMSGHDRADQAHRGQGLHLQCRRQPVLRCLKFPELRRDGHAAP
jgi:hypothetical protein